VLLSGGMLKQAWHCRQLEGFFPLEVPSETDPSKTYTVTVDPYANRSELHACSCPAYTYKGRCKHQKTAHLQICGWNELDGPEKMEKEGICPRCGNESIQAVYEINDEAGEI
jgi:hypothetical protein